MANRFSTLAIALSLVVGSAGGQVEAQSKLRKRVTQVVEARFPGFRVVGPEDYDPAYRTYFRDGRVGTIIEGRFDYDSFRDFAALLVAKERPVANSPVDMNGKQVICYGSRSGVYRCTESPGVVSPPLEGYLYKASSGTYSCLEQDGDRKITTTIDSIGWVYVEKSAWFEAVTRDGQTRQCFTSD